MRKLLDGGVGSAEDQDEVSTWCVYVSVSDVLTVFSMLYILCRSCTLQSIGMCMYMCQCACCYNVRITVYHL